jgi:hypothetical protein
VNPVDLVTAVIVAFFALGIIAGIACVIAISALHSARARARREHAPPKSRNAMDHEFGDGRTYRDDRDWEEPPSPDDGDEGPPHWPGYRGLPSGGN